MNIDQIRHEIVMVKGGLDELSNLLSNSSQDSSCWVLIESLSARLQDPIDNLEKMEMRETIV